MEKTACSICGKGYIKKRSYNLVTKSYFDVWYPLCTCEYNEKKTAGMM